MEEIMATKIVVFGSFVVDLASRADHLPRPAETVIGSVFALGPGGKGSNQGVAAHRAGADVCMITKVGDDVFGKVALDFYQSEGMNTDLIFVDKEKETGTALIMVDENSAQNQILVVPGACGNINDEDIERATPAIKDAQIILMQMEVNLDANWKVLDIAHKNGVKVVLNTAPAQKVDDAILAKVNVLTPNEVEASILSGVEVVTMDDARRAAEVFQKKGVEEVVITMGAQGAYVRSGSRELIIPRLNVEAIDTTGAGDAFNGGLVTALAEGKDLFAAAEFANVVGALSVTKKGTAPAMPFRKDIDAFMRK
jgi:ribokinase